MDFARLNMGPNLAEPLRLQLEDECKKLHRNSWQNITAAHIPWNLFPSLSGGERAISELVHEGNAILSFFQKRWEEQMKGSNSSVQAGTGKRTARVKFQDLPPMYPLEYLSENCQICILLNTLNKSEVVDQIPTLRNGLPLTRDDLSRFIDDSSTIITFLTDQRRFLHNVKPTSEITFIPREEFPPYRAIKVLGSGTCSTVEEVRNVITDKTFARKLFRMSVVKDWPSVRRVLRELEHLDNLVGDSHVVQLAGCYVWKSDIGILLEPAAEYDLRKYLESFPSSSRLPTQGKRMERVLSHMFGCLCITLNSICRTKRMRHKDIKPENILIHKEDVLFTDFGSAIAIQDRGTTSGTNVGAVTDMYCAPEVLRQEIRDITADVFSLGCVYLEILAALVRKDGNLWRSFNDPYGQDLSKIQKLLNDLKGECDDWLSLPLSWCSRMVEEREQRPTIDELIGEIITTPAPDPSQFFCNGCLRELMLIALKMLTPTNQEEPTASVSSETERDTDNTAEGKDGEAVLGVEMMIKDGNTALHLAAQAGKEAVLRELVDGGANIDAQNKDGNTALHLAAQAGEEAVLRELVDGGADIDVQNKDGNTALHLAAQAGKEVVLRELVDGGADIDAQNKDGNTALHLAAQTGEEAVLRELKKADINSVNEVGNTALHLAVQARREAVSRELVKKRARIDILNDQDETALDLILRIIRQA
ncbi:uncharacterized protein PAC_20060 [Phialocephala subalpina]|uniref:Protein kinase domain-containing protein n=1 Tax=Phialocephala subalpina TaxID=576137 RepID=A0A1L7XYR0_9HELO|nr:uncharacterized protein PAC_20060 [Phialocephala subalpina]